MPRAHRFIHDSARHVVTCGDCLIEEPDRIVWVAQHIAPQPLGLVEVLDWADCLPHVCLACDDPGFES